MNLSNDYDEMYRILFEKFKDAILIIKNGIFVDCNKATVEMLSYENKTALLQTHPSELSPDIHLMVKILLPKQKK